MDVSAEEKGRDSPLSFLRRKLAAHFVTRRCDHDWQYDHEESQGPWTGYMERCSKCGALSQVPV